MASSLSEDWRVEYRELSEDFRVYVQMGWQATFAVLFGDALVVSYISSFRTSAPAVFSTVMFLTGFVTILMGWETIKWIVRSGSRIGRMRTLDRRHGFTRFAETEVWYLRIGIGKGLVGVLMLAGAILIAIAVINFQDANLLQRFV
jgi:hypothetical protein